MKIIFTFLFFTDMLLLLFLSSVTLRVLDKPMSTVAIMLLFSGIILCIFLLVYFFYRYLKIPPGKS